MVAVPDVVALAKLLVMGLAKETTATTAKEHSGSHPFFSSSYGSNAYGNEEEEEEEIEEIEEDLVHTKTVCSREVA